MFGLLFKTLFTLQHFVAWTFAKPVQTGRPEVVTHVINYVDIEFPIVLLHGLGGSVEKMTPLCDWLERTFRRQVYNLEIGNGEETSLYTPLPIQLAELCKTIYNIPELQNGFDFIGMSQGGLLARGYVEQCNHFPVRNLITLVTPHGGVFFGGNTGNMYTDFNQQHLSLAGYWRNPYRLKEYLDKSCYLPILNNEKPINNKQTQKEHICNLSNFVMIWSPTDGVLHPAESGKFSFYDEKLNIIPLEQTELYKTDALGLKFLNDAGRLCMYKTNCSHFDHRNPICFNQLYGILVNYI
jgi:palmitoyl-protein thioesterase